MQYRSIFTRHLRNYQTFPTPLYIQMTSGVGYHRIILPTHVQARTISSTDIFPGFPAFPVKTSYFLSTHVSFHHNNNQRTFGGQWEVWFQNKQHTGRRAEGNTIYLGGDAGDFEKENEKMSPTVIYQYLMKLDVACHGYCVSSQQGNFPLLFHF